jgi:arabinofuranosyltransferase
MIGPVAGENPGATARGRGPMRAWLLGVAVLTCGVALSVTTWDQLNDDAWITFRYARSLAEGQGPYFNPDEHVEGYSNFLLMLILAAAIRILGPAAAYPVTKLIGLLGAVVAIAGAALLARHLLDAPGTRSRAASLGWAAGALVAVNSGFALNVTSGLETTLFSALLTLGLVLLAPDGAWRGAGFAFALAAWTRPEGAFLFGGVLLARVAAGEWRSGARRHLVVDTAVVGLAVIAQVALRRWAYDGEWLPNTYYAKAGGMATLSAQGYILQFVYLQLTPALAPLAMLPLIVGGPALRRRALPALGLALSGIVAVLLSGSDWMPGHRLLVPYLPAWAALVVAAIVGVTQRAPWPPVQRELAAAVTLLAAVAGTWTWQQGIRTALWDYSDLRTRGYVTGHAALARWLAQRSQPGDTIALMDIGIVGWMLPRHTILDISGLTDRTIARSPGGFLDKQYPLDYVLGRQPAYVVLVFTTRGDRRLLWGWTPVERRLFDDPRFSASYRRVRRSEGLPALEAMAAVLGAERVFAHELQTPYLLAVFHRSLPARSASPAR